MSSEKFVVKVANKPTVKISESTTLVSKIVVGTPIRTIDAASFDASTLAGESAGYYQRWDNLIGIPAIARMKNIADATEGDSGVYVTGTARFQGSIIPDSDIRYNLGTPTKRWGSLYVKGDTIFVGNLAISDAGNGQIQTASAEFEIDSIGQVITDFANVKIVSFVDSAAIISTIDNWVRDTDGDSNGGPGLNDYFDSAYINSRVDTTTITNVIDSAYVQSISGVESKITDLSTTTTDQTVDQFNKLIFRTCKYVIQLEHDASNKYQSSEILLTHNGTDVFITEYGIVQTDESLGEFSAVIIGNGVFLLLTPTYTNTSFKARRISVSA